LKSGEKEFKLNLMGAQETRREKGRFYQAVIMIASMGLHKLSILASFNDVISGSGSIVSNGRMAVKN
jgi:hypothetical protein